MGEPESLAEVEPLEAHIRRHGYDRLIMLSDGVFAIATTLAAIEVKLPHGETLGAMLAAGRGQLAAYVLSFLLTAIYWVQHRDLFARLQRVDQAITVLTLAVLCLVALLPAAIHALYAGGVGGVGGPAFKAYVLLMAMIGAINFVMWLYVEWRGDLLHPGVPLRYRLTRLVVTGMAPLILLPALLVPIERLGFAVLPVVAIMLVLRRFVVPMVARRHPQHMQ